MHRTLVSLFLLAVAASPGAQAAPACGGEGPALQVLGSGDGSLAGKRAGPGLLLWVDGKARVLINAGSGVALRFQESGAQWNDLDAILFTHIDATHSADLPALLQATQTSGRTRALPVYGPAGNRFAPATVAYVRDLFDPVRGAYRHLGQLLAPLERSGYKLEPHDVREPPAKLAAPRRKELPLTAFTNERIQVRAVLKAAAAGAPTASWRLDAGAKGVVIDDGTPDTTSRTAVLTEGAALLVTPLPLADAAIRKDTQLQALVTIAQIAQTSRVQQLLLAGRGARTAFRDEEIAVGLRPHFTARTTLAEDLACHIP